MIRAARTESELHAVLRRLRSAARCLWLREEETATPSCTTISAASMTRQVLAPDALLCAITDTGKIRESNEDAFRIAGERRAFLVADGMGGRQGGEIASFVAAETFTELASEIPLGPEYLRRGFDEAQDRVLERAQADSACAGMGTAVVVAALDGDRVHIGHLGDARAYLGRGGDLRRLTTDHSTGRNTLYKAIGFDERLAPDLSFVDLTPGDRVLLCSDGLWGELPDSEIKAVLGSDGTTWQLAHILLNRALAAGGHDNITLVLYEHPVQQDVADGEETKDVTVRPKCLPIV